MLPGGERLRGRRAAVRSAGAGAGAALPAVLIALAVAVRIWNAGAYDPRHQHDARVHIGYLRELAQGHLPASYNAPWYYLVTGLVALPVIVLCRLLGASDETLLRLAVGFAGTVLFAAFVAGSLALGRALGLGERDARWYAALAGTFPVVARTYNMVRPENLILTLLPWAVVLLLRWAPEAGTPTGRAVRAPAFWALAAAQALMLAQKVGGLVVVATLPALLLATGARPLARRVARAALTLWAAGGILALALVAVQLLVAGTTPFRHDREGDSRFRAAPAGFFVTLDPAGVWREPFRDAHRGSMPAILLIDLYGDYWRFGIDQATLGRTEPARLRRARFGILAGAVFAALWLGSVAHVVARRFRPPPGVPRPDLALTAAALLPLAASALYLAVAALRFYAPEDGDIAKWEYVVWVFVFLPLPLLQATAGLRAGGARAAGLALWSLAAAGLLQSVVTRAF